MSFEVGHKPVRKRPVSEAVKRIESSAKGAGKIRDKAQLKHILANANRGECAERNVALIWFLFGSLTRITETCYLRVKDVFYKSGEFKAIFRVKKDYAKGGQSRDCALVLKQQRKALLAWRDKRIQDKAFLSNDGSYGGLSGDSPLFLSFKGQKGLKWVSLAFHPKKYTTIDGKIKETMVCSSMENYIRELFKKCGFKRGSSHSGRKSTSSFLSDMGVPYDVIQMAIGHVSDDMTDTYIIPNPQRLTDALNNLYKTVPPLGVKD
ncbi:tyrosine-type recombinase/integrase [Colwellia sp. 4_MG-2023]|uniref:tyrosine-type recombinase/integrase n=1 Tax=unclassified Colwellia TaxID=196834 RepID=UPI0026E3A556|nr:MULTISPECIES: tyrosine-type recombinase/integrase [unclassified Colwellia]MDO6508755.1 tyrosine-type recombinase/integrase [Colwellia sp. 5_MG-2023]MDO6557420.1 tyrosine-type recombinase/integrase [Colwellia sp. 4_MG-2023]